MPNHRPGTQDTVDPGSGERRRAVVVLCVDDDDDSRVLSAICLTQAGFTVLQARDGIEAIESVREMIPDLVVMDLGLPRMSGLDATRELKANARTRDVPVVALTANVYPKHRASAEAAGCVAFIEKPATPERIVSEVMRAITDARRKRDGAQRQA